jgi:hypothetical protein
MSELEDAADHLTVADRGRVIADTSVREVLATTSQRPGPAAHYRGPGGDGTDRHWGHRRRTGVLEISHLSSERTVARLAERAMPFTEVSAHRWTLTWPKSGHCRRHPCRGRRIARSREGDSRPWGIAGKPSSDFPPGILVASYLLTEGRSGYKSKSRLQPKDASQARRPPPAPPALIMFQRMPHTHRISGNVKLVDWRWRQLIAARVPRGLRLA